MFAWSARGEAATVVAGTNVDGAAMASARSAWAHPITVVAGMTGEGAALASVPSDGVGSDSNCGGGHDR
jgi:hypothetical protein